jgi:hypothetical protein
MDRQTLDPLKQLRQQHATATKLLIVENKQRAGVLREQEKVRAAEAAEKASNEEHLKTPLPAVSSGSADITIQEQTINTAIGQPHAAQGAGDTGPEYLPETPLQDPEILPDAMGDVHTEGTPKGSTLETSQTYTLENEQEGETLSGTKEMRAEEDNEVENTSKMPKGSLIPTGTTK